MATGESTTHIEVSWGFYFANVLILVSDIWRTPKLVSVNHNISNWAISSGLVFSFEAKKTPLKLLNKIIRNRQLALGW